MITDKPGKLYIVATPIGNLGDMTPRAVEILRESDIIAAEDTKNSMKLLTKFEIKTKLVSNHKFNESGAAEYFINALLNGQNVALISDAGTPCVSDPGSALVKKAAEHGITVEAVPGACAAIAALSVSGYSAKPGAHDCEFAFIFGGFFPRGGPDAKKTAQKIKNSPGVYIFYESPKRIIKTLEIFAEYLPDSDICLCNDLTKKFERIYRGPPAAVLEGLRANPSAEKGEYTIVLEANEAGETFENLNPSSIESIIVDVMISRKCSIKDAVKYIASEDIYGFNKNEVYAASLNLKKIFLQYIRE